MSHAVDSRASSPAKSARSLRLPSALHR